MSLQACRECGQQVSTEAEVCPHCGVRSPASGQPFAVEKPKAENTGCLKAILMIVGVVAVAGVFGIILQVQETNQEIRSPSCKSDWTKCANNEELVKKYQKWRDAQSECGLQAIKLARYGKPVVGFFESFYPGNNYVTSGIATAIDPDAQFQNGFGAMVHSRVICTYDLRTNKVTNVEVTQR